MNIVKATENTTNVTKKAMELHVFGLWDKIIVEASDKSCRIDAPKQSMRGKWFPTCLFIGDELAGYYDGHDMEFTKYPADGGEEQDKKIIEAMDKLLSTFLWAPKDTNEFRYTLGLTNDMEETLKTLQTNSHAIGVWDKVEAYEVGEFFVAKNGDTIDITIGKDDAQVLYATVDIQLDKFSCWISSACNYRILFGILAKVSEAYRKHMFASDLLNEEPNVASTSLINGWALNPLWILWNLKNNKAKNIGYAINAAIHTLADSFMDDDTSEVRPEFINKGDKRHLKLIRVSEKEIVGDAPSE